MRRYFNSFNRKRMSYQKRSSTKSYYRHLLSPISSAMMPVSTTYTFTLPCFALFGICGSLMASASASYIQQKHVTAASESTKLELLHDCQEPDIDIVFIHGLNGDMKKTWQNEESCALFFDLLQNDTKLAHLQKRIWSFGYPNSLFSSNQNEPMSLENMGSNFFSHLYHSAIMNNNTPIVFIAHSMGGLVAKKSIIQSEKTENKPSSYYGDMFALHKRIRGIIFYGVPHLGSDVADLLELLIGNNSWSVLNPLSWLSSLFGYKPSLSIEELSVSNMNLITLQKDFVNWAYKEGKEVNILSFIETRAEPYLNKIVVKEQQCRNLLPLEEEIFLPFCHSEICKPSNCDDLRYIPIRKYIAKLVLGFQQKVADLEAMELQKMQKINADLKQRQLDNERMKQEQIRLEQERQRLVAERNRIQQQQQQRQPQPPPPPPQPTYASKKCSWCNGYGSDRVRNSRCRVCRGNRQIKVLSPAKQCNACKGRGSEHGNLKKICSGCGGFGWWNAKV